jgi:ketosteroid isomerase-like protein
METAEIAARLVALCREGRFDQCYDELFAEDAENIEMPEMADGPLGNARGLPAMRRKAQAWSEGVEQVHSSSVGDPVVAGSWFALPMTMDVTPKGRGRVAMDELCLYRVRDGRIVREQFFYDVDQGAAP